MSEPESAAPVAYVTPATVNDHDTFGECWICGDKDDHSGLSHADATGDGLTRYDVLDYLAQVKASDRA
jgi:hypothetical protein